jgi:hypothetical protein
MADDKILGDTPAVRDEKALYDDKHAPELVAAPRRASVAMNIVENPLQVSLLLLYPSIYGTGD